MDNQHRKITGYRDLSQQEIDLMNKIKAKGEEVRELIEKVENSISTVNEQHGIADADARRWAATAKTDLQKGFMSLTRAIARPTSF